MKRKVIRIGWKNRIQKIDVKAGELTFGQRIELGKIFSGKDDGLFNALLKFEKTFVCLHNYQPTLKQYKKLAPYFKDIIAGLKYISDRETAMQYEPLISEIASTHNHIITESKVVKELANNLRITPEELLQWKYSDVYNILLDDYTKGITRNKIILCN